MNIDQIDLLAHMIDDLLGQSVKIKAENVLLKTRVKVLEEMLFPKVTKEDELDKLQHEDCDNCALHQSDDPKDDSDFLAQEHMEMEIQNG